MNTHNFFEKAKKMIGIGQRRSCSRLTREDLEPIKEQLHKIMRTLEDVLDDVKAERTLTQSLITLTNGIKAQLDEVLKGALTPEQQAKVDAIFDEVEAGKKEVSDAIVANTTPTTPPPTA